MQLQKSKILTESLEKNVSCSVQFEQTVSIISYENRNE